MARRRGQRKGYLRPENGNWLLTYRVYTRECPRGKRITVTIGPADGPGKLTKKQAERFAYDHYLQKLDTTVLKPLTTMTVAEFWERKYLPHLTRKKFATQTQYKSIWKTWIEPACGTVRMFELSPDNVDSAIAAALAAGRSTATAKHVRKVASAIWSHARRMQCASGENPAQCVEPVTVEPVRKLRALSAEQCATVIPELSEPARTMVLMSITMSLNVSELLGLTEKHINFTDEVQVLDGNDVVPPHWIAVREQLYHGRRGNLKTGKRRRNLPMPTVVEDALRSLITTNKSRGPEAPVFQTSVGTAHSADNLAKRALGRTAQQLRKAEEQKPETERDEFRANLQLNWHLFRHTHATLTKAIGMSDYDRQRLMGHASVDMTDRYTHEDRTRLKQGVERLAAQIAGKPEQNRKIVSIAEAR